MLTKFIAGAISVVSFTMIMPAFAENVENCRIEVAISTPPVQLDQNVAFNVTSDSYANKSITLKGGSAPQHIENLGCSTNDAYTISATLYNTPSNNSLTAKSAKPIGQCQLKAGPVAMRFPGDSVSVVFPNDFVCDPNS